jgi:hypothetical protein
MASAKPTMAIDLIISAPSGSFVATLVGCKPLFEQSLLYEGAGGTGDQMKKSASTFAGRNNCFFSSRLSDYAINTTWSMARGLKSPLSIRFVADGAIQEIIWASWRPLPAKRALRPQSVRPILKHLNFFDRDQSALHHSIQDRQKPINLLLRVDDLDDYW